MKQYLKRNRQYRIGAMMSLDASNINSYDSLNYNDSIKSLIDSEKTTKLVENKIHSVLEHVGNYIEEPYDIIQSYFGNKHLERLVRHQVESYNHFINVQMQHTINMFNPVIIHSENDYDITKDKYSLEIELYFQKCNILPPQIHENNGATKNMFPSEAKLRNFTYSSIMNIDILIKYHILDTEQMDNKIVVEKLLKKINIGRMPIMVKSSCCMLSQNRNIPPTMNGECKMDPGGYFIIKGSEKTVLGQERVAENKIYCFNNKNKTKWLHSAEIKSVPHNKCISPKQIDMHISSKNNGFGNVIYVNIPRMKQPIELFVIFRVLGVISDKDICKHIVLDIDDENNKHVLEFLRASIFESSKYIDQKSSLEYFTSNISYTTPFNTESDVADKKRKKFVNDILESDMLPHCNNTQEKIFFLGYMARKLILTSMGLMPFDDRDSYLNKRIELCGTLINNLFRNYFNKLVKEMQKQILKEINNGSWRSSDNYENIINHTNIYKIIKSTTIENGINRALSTGDFSIKQSNSSKVGVAQVLNRLTYIATVSHLRRINTPLEKSGELIEPRKLHSTTWGFLCPVETPEGQSVGVVKNISYLCHITIPTNNVGLHKYVEDYTKRFDNSTFTEISKCVKVFINGAWVGITDKPIQLYDSLKKKKYSGIINIYTSIVFDYLKKEIRICNDAGRLTRPLYKVKNNKVLLTKDVVNRINSKDLCWNDLITNSKLDESIIEYIDPEEQNHAMIAMKSKQKVFDNFRYNYSHCEIHPSTMFGILASCVPFPEHNQAPRNTYQCAMGKQAIGIYATNFDTRMDKTTYILNYPSRPLVETRVMDFINLDSIPSGTQIHVAIMTHGGYNQEDSVLINKGSIDRGLFLATIYHTEKDEDKNIIRDEIIRCKPDKTVTKGIKYGNYDKLNNNGFMEKDSLVENRDVIISKIVPIKENRNDPTKLIKYEDQSKTHRTNEECYIDRNYTNRNGDGYDFAKVKIRTTRKPVLGDKVSSRHGQKGTVGNIIPECDMPFSKDGIKPDIIINPHAIPSRMTIGQLKETLLGKVLLELGMFGDGTSFSELDIKTICNELQKCGYESYGNEVLYNGMTGEQLEINTFIGPVFYQRLKHMVNDKQHSRSIGPMVNLTRQPAEGRSRDGGFRVGEMERDVLIAHGMTNFCKDRLYDVSDKYSTYVCKRCGMIASYNDGMKNNVYRDNDVKIHLCQMCNNTSDFAKVNMPYSYKLMAQELQTINIIPRIITQ
jgi:DNA-directed RNA polymerase II subunit RPB2